VYACAGGSWAISVDGVERRRADAEAALETALSDIELFVAEQAEEVVFVHAGCVAVDGRAILLPGHTLAGKTSLTRALVDAGADYYSDEFAVLSSDGTVSPYPRPLAVRTDSGATRRVAVALDRIASAAVPIGMIAMLRYDPSSGWEVRRPGKAAAVLNLMSHTVPAQLRPRASLAAVSRATAGAQTIIGSRGESDAAAALLLGMLDVAGSEPAGRAGT
jgi:hypothetical protein